MLSGASRPRVALSAVSSFTGTWIARAFHAAGWTVLPVCSRPRSAYGGLRLARIERVEECVPVHFGCEAADGSLAAWIEKHRPHIWVHHHHFMDRFRSPDYDLARALRIGLGSLPGILAAVASGGGLGVIYSGTYFEQGEQGQIWQASGPTPYAMSKTRVWGAIRRQCEPRGLRLAKIVIPNPVGPLENDDRLIPCMIRHSEASTVLRLRSPGQFVDNLPITDLAADYVRAAKGLLTKRGRDIIRPSGRISTTLDWVRFAGEELLARRLGLPPCKLEYDRLSVRAIPRHASNSIDWTGAWDAYANHFGHIAPQRRRLAA